MYPMKQRSLLLLLLALSVTLSVGWDLIPLPDASERRAAISTQGTGFSSREIPLSNAERKQLRGAEVTKRLYSFEGELIWFSCIDGSRNRNSVHDPAYCLLASGWSVRNQQTIALGKGQGKLLSLERRGETTELLYWFSTDNSSYHSLPRYWFETTMRRITRGHSGSEPILVLLRPHDQNNHFDWHRFAEVTLPQLNVH